MKGSNHQRLLSLVALSSIIPVADAHSFEWVPNVVGGTLAVQLVPLLWVLRWRTPRFTWWFVASIILSWPIAIGGIFLTNSAFAAVILAAPWVVSFVFGFMHERSNKTIEPTR